MMDWVLAEPCLSYLLGDMLHDYRALGTPTVQVFAALNGCEIA